MKEVIRQLRLEVILKIIRADKKEDTWADFLVQPYLEERKVSLCNKCWKLTQSLVTTSQVDKTR